METKETLALLKISRVIWVDDWFMEDAAEIASTLVKNLETTRACGFAEFPEEMLQAADDDPGGTIPVIAEVLLKLDVDRRRAIRSAFLAKEHENNTEFATADLKEDQVKQVCELLDVKPEDRFSFGNAEAKLAQVCNDGDAQVMYVIDLKDASGDPHSERGLELVKVLANCGSKGTAFLLTHEAQLSSETEVEKRLRATLQAEGADAPLCVIAKERLESDGHAGVAEGLQVALKRAGLRRAVHEVLLAAVSKVQSAIGSATGMLLEVPPEQLDRYVVDKAFKEGVSELHVIERALTAHVSATIRETLASDAASIASAVRLRALRSIELKIPADPVHSHLKAFRTKEIWEDGDLINKTHSPVVLGDVFEIKAEEKSDAPPKMYILLGQACDIQLRADGDRDADMAIFVPLKISEAAGAACSVRDKLKELPLPIEVQGSNWTCDFRSPSAVRLDVLDLASYRDDGLVRFDLGQVAPDGLLPGLHAKADKLFKTMTGAIDALKAINQAKCKGVQPTATQLVPSDSNAFNRIRYGKYRNKTPGSPERITWSLRRCGRIRSPYPAWLLSTYLALVGRDAFDVDFTA